MFCWSEVSSAAAAWGFRVALCAGGVSEYTWVLYAWVYTHDKSLSGIHTHKYIYLCLVWYVYHDMCNSPACMYIYIHLRVCTHTHTRLYHTKQPTLKASSLGSFQTLKQHSPPNMLLLKELMHHSSYQNSFLTQLYSAEHELWVITLYFDIEIKLVLKR